MLGWQHFFKKHINVCKYDLIELIIIIQIYCLEGVQAIYFVVVFSSIAGDAI